jgi:hypothetical protein
MHSQPELEQLVNEYGAGRQLPLEEIEDVLTKLLTDKEASEDLNRASAKLMNSTRGSAQRTLEAVLKK